MDSLEKQFSDVDLIQTGYEDFYIYTDKYIEIADKHAVNFAKWYQFAFTKGIYQLSTCEQLLEQYKKENLLNTI